MLDAALDVQVAVSHNSQPHLPPTDSDKADSLPPKFLDVEDKDADVNNSRKRTGVHSTYGRRRRI